MSVTLSLNDSIPIIPWKGETLNQLTSFIKQNKPQATGSLAAKFKANPLKIYRREIASTTVGTCNPRTSTSIDLMNAPNGTIINSQATVKNGIENTLDINTPNNSCLNTESCVLSTAENARRRVRSSGMIPKKYDVSRNNDTYHTSTKQYLTSRNKTYSQNQYNYIRQGDSAAVPGTGLSTSNVYSAQGLNHCQKYYIGADTNFKYSWTTTSNTTDFTVDIPKGYYDIETLNQALRRTMYSNKHYIKKTPDNTLDYLDPVTTDYYIGIDTHLAFLLNITYNIQLDKLELQSFQYSTSLFPTSNYSIPYGSTIGSGYPMFVITQNLFSAAIGFTDSGTTNYPLNNTNDNNAVKIFHSQSQSKIFPLYKQVYYKPNNHKFAQQGAVSASDLLVRRKFDTINTTAATYKGAYGNHVANSLAYGVPTSGHIVKEKLGYPIKKTPTVSSSGEMRNCIVTKIAHLI
tara:strand:+ start:1259 stop:2638 length:1380 start_codon:yes stop_codon:yes gene_type:complete